MPAIPPAFRFYTFPEILPIMLCLSVLVFADLLCRLYALAVAKRQLQLHVQPTPHPAIQATLRISVPTSSDSFESSADEVFSPALRQTSRPFKSHSKGLHAAAEVARTSKLEARLSKMVIQHFADRVVLTNKIWAQQALIMRLHGAMLESRDGREDELERARADTEAARLEAEKAKRGSVRSIVTMAKTMAKNRDHRTHPQAVTLKTVHGEEEGLKAALRRTKKENQALKDQVSGYEGLIDALYSDLHKPLRSSQ